MTELTETGKLNDKEFNLISRFIPFQLRGKTTILNDLPFVNLNMEESFNIKQSDSMVSPNWFIDIYTSE